jgi:hypothetical protein
VILGSRAPENLSVIALVGQDEMKSATSSKEEGK